jgi:predicted O-methyltransferase YrrM
MNDKSSYKNAICIDRAHNALLFGSILSAKPEHVLELGVGMGYATKSILLGLRFNGVGKLTSVDSCRDFENKEPPHFKELKEMGAEIVIQTEEEFTKRQPEGTYDFLVSDADHRHAANWVEGTLKMMKPGSVMFFHDTNWIPELYSIKNKLKSHGVPSFHFKKSSLPNERCERGWLMAFKE